MTAVKLNSEETSSDRTHNGQKWANDFKFIQEFGKKENINIKILKLYYARIWHTELQWTEPWNVTKSGDISKSMTKEVSKYIPYFDQLLVPNFGLHDT